MHDNGKIHSESRRELGLKILLVDDHALNRFMVQTILEKWKCSVAIAEDGLEAIQSVMKDPDFDLILMDMRMPVMDGKTASDFIRNRLKSTIPIIAITSDTIQYNNNDGVTGITDFISKPFDQEELFKKSKRALEARIPKLPVCCMDLISLFNDGSSDSAFVAKMIDLFLEDTPGKIKMMQQAIEAKDQQSLMDIAHTIKPSLQYLASSCVSETAINVEKNENPSGNLIYAESLLLIDELKRLSAELHEFRLSLKV